MRFANVTFWWFLVCGLQWLVGYGFIERYILEQPELRCVRARVVYVCVACRFVRLREECRFFYSQPGWSACCWGRGSTSHKGIPPCARSDALAPLGLVWPLYLSQDPYSPRKPGNVPRASPDNHLYFSMGDPTICQVALAPLQYIAVVPVAGSIPVEETRG